MLFNLGAPLQLSTLSLETGDLIRGQIVPERGAVVLLPRRARLALAADGVVDMLSIRLRSATCFPLLGVALDELEISTPLAELGLPFPISVLLSQTDEMRISQLEQWLLGILNRNDRCDSRLTWAVDKLYYGDNLRVIRNQLGINERTLQRRIQQFTGVDARYFCRTARFQRTLRHILSGNSILDCAIQHGYADQSHFIKTCRLFTGRTPCTLLTTQYRQLNHYWPVKPST